MFLRLTEFLAVLLMVWARRGSLALELSSWSFARKHVGPLLLEMQSGPPGDIAMADGSRPGHPTHSGKSMLQPAAVKLVLVVGAGAEVD